MSQSKIAKYYIPCLLLILFRSYVLSMPQAQPPDSGSTQLQAGILTGTWPIRKVVSNSSGDLIFAGGDFHEGPDGLVLVTPNRVVKIAATGDDAPGRPGLFLQSFGLFRNHSYTGDFSFNDRHDLAFIAYLMNCNGPSLEACGVSPPTQNGLFLFSESSKQTIAAVGDPAPGSAGGVFNEFLRTVINNNGTVLFAATVRLPDGSITGGLFLFSANGIEKVYVNGDPTPVGPTNMLVPGLERQTPMFLTDDGAAIFASNLQIASNLPNIAGQVLFRYQNGTISKLIAAGDSVSGSGVLREFFDVSANSRGDIVFRANGGSPGQNESLNYIGKYGSSFKIIGSEDTTPAGDKLKFWGYGGSSISPYPLSWSFRPKVNDYDEVLFDSSFYQGNTTGQGLFLFSSGEVRKIVADRDPVPGSPDSVILFGGAEFSFNNLGMAIFSAYMQTRLPNGFQAFPGVFSYAAGSLSRILLKYDAAPGTDGESFVGSDSLSLGNSGQVGLHATVCCGTFKEGIFLGQIVALPIPNGDFQALGGGGLPEHWQTVWTNSGTGEAFQYNGTEPEIFSGTSALRLHVDQGGGSLFVLSDPIPIASNARYLITSQMRYGLASPDDAVYFSIIQFDDSDNPVGFDELRGSSEDNHWTWVPKALPIRTTANTASIRIRFGLVSSTENYLDVDAVR
jgi:hypothetical protein